MIGRVRSRPSRGKRRTTLWWLEFPGGRFVYNDKGRAFDSATHAEAVLETIRHQVLHGSMSLAEAVAACRPAGPAEGAVDTLAERWLAHLERFGGVSPQTQRRYASLVHRHWHRWAGKPLVAIETADLWDWRGELEAGGLGPGSVRNVLVAWRSFVAWYQEGHRGYQAPSTRRLLPQAPARSDTMTVPEQQRVVDAIPEPDRGIFLACAQWGLRPQEARAFRICDVDRAGRRVRLSQRLLERGADSPRADGTKAGRDLGWFPASLELWAWIQRCIPASRWFHVEHPLFAGPGGKPYTHDRLRTLWRRACRDAGVPYLTLHRALRATTFNAAAEQGASSLQIRGLSGHATATLERSYVGQTVAMKQAAMDARQRALDAPEPVAILRGDPRR